MPNFSKDQTERTKQLTGMIQERIGDVVKTTTEADFPKVRKTIYEPSSKDKEINAFTRARIQTNGRPIYDYMTIPSDYEKSPQFSRLTKVPRYGPEIDKIKSLIEKDVLGSDLRDPRLDIFRDILKKDKKYLRIPPLLHSYLERGEHPTHYAQPNEKGEKIETPIPKEYLKKWQPLGALLSDIREGQPEYEAYERLNKVGVDVLDPKIKKEFASKPFSPSRMAEIMRGENLGTGIDADIQKFFAYRQARKEALERGEEYQVYPSVSEMQIENPNEYKGERVAPFDEKTRLSFQAGEEARRLADEVEAGRLGRFQNVIRSIDDEPLQADLERRHMGGVDEQQRAFQDVYNRQLSEFQKHRDFNESPYYKDVLGGTEKLYDLLSKREDEDFNKKVLPSLKGRFASAGALNSSGYHNAINEATRAHRDRLAQQHALMLEKARQEGMRHHEFETRAQYQNLAEMRNVLGANLEHGSKRFAQSVQANSADKLRALQMEDMRRKNDLERIQALTGQQSSLEAEGRMKEQQRAREIEAQMKAHQERPGGPQEQLQLAHLLSAVQGNPGAPVALPSAAPTYIPPVSAAGANAVLASGLAQPATQLMHAFGAHHQGMNLQEAMQQQQMMAGRRAFAAGGHVSPLENTPFIDQYRTQLEAYKRAKDLHAQRAIPSRNPALQGLGDVSQAMGARLGTGKSMLGGWSEGMNAAGKRFDDFYEKEHAQSLQRALLEKELSGLIGKGEKYAETGRHNRATEEENRRLHEMQAAHHREEMAFNRQKHEFDVGKHLYESQNKPLSEKNTKAIEDAENGLHGMTNIVGKAILLKNTSPYVRSGTGWASLGNTVASMTPGNTLAGLDWYDQQASELAMQMAEHWRGDKSKYSVELLQENKMHRGHEKESNVATGKRLINDKTEAAAQFIKNAEKRGKSAFEIAEELEHINHRMRGTIDEQVKTFASAQGISKEERDKILEESYDDWNKTYRELNSAIKKKKIDDSHAHNAKAESSEYRGSGKGSEGKGLFHEIISSDQAGAPGIMQERMSVDTDDRTRKPDFEIKETKVGNEAPVIEVDEEEPGILESLGRASLGTIKGIPHAAAGAAEGVSNVLDLLATPLRHGVSHVTGDSPEKMEVTPYIRSAIKKVLGNEPEQGTAAHYMKKAGEVGGEVASLFIPGASAVRVGKLMQSLPGWGSKIGRGVEHFGSMLGGSSLAPEVSATAPSLKELGLFGAAMAPGATYLEEEQGFPSLLANLASGVATGGAHTLAKHGLSSINLKDLPYGPVSSLERGMENRIAREIGEHNIDTALERLKSYEKPSSLEGYEPTTAQRVYRPKDKNPLIGFPQLERAIAGSHEGLSQQQAMNKQILKESLENTYPEVPREKAHDILRSEFKADKARVEEAKEALSRGEGNILSEDDLGSVIRETTEKSLKDLKAIRRKETEPLYEKVKKSRHILKRPEKTRALYEEFVDEGVPDALKGKMSTLEMLARPTTDNFAYAGKFEGERQNFMKRYNSAKESGNYQDALYYKRIINAMEDDLATAVPEARKAREAYKILSEPINLIESNPDLSSAISRDAWGIPQTLDTTTGIKFSEGRASKERVNLLKKALGEEGKYIESFKDYGESKALADLIHPDTGAVGGMNDVRKWMKKHAGIMEAHPSLEKNLTDLGEAQEILAGKIGRQRKGTRDIYAEAETPQEMVARSLVGADRGENVKGLLSRLANKKPEKAHAKNADAFVRSEAVKEALVNVARSEGQQSYMAGVVDHMLNTLTNGGKDFITPAGYKRYMKSHGSILKKHLPKKQYEMISDLGKALDSQSFAEYGGMGPNSHTMHGLRIMERLLEKTLPSRVIDFSLHTAPVLKDAVGALAKLGYGLGKTTERIKSEHVADFLRDPKKAISMLERMKRKSQRGGDTMGAALIARPLARASYLGQDRKQEES